MKLAPMLAAVTLALAVPTVAHAFCGFYVAGGDQKMFNDATQVVLMRMGTRTVLSMQNNYKGPPEAFAMVVPVPVVLHEGDVKTLTKDVFAHVEQMGAPRLVEYWEQDPCGRDENEYTRTKGAAMPAPPMSVNESKKSEDLGVTIEAKFTVGEYNVLILSAKDSTGLETWLKQEKYTIPDGAEPLLRPYVEGGMKFFVAKVDPAKVAFVDGRAALSPLRFHYDSEEFALPIRLGLANSSGTQDLIVNILAPHQRYEVSNYKNVTIPTNIEVAESMKEKFGAFYTALYDRTVEKNPNAVVTEYAWQATTCDPCPGPALNQADFLTLGADALQGSQAQPTAYQNADFVLTRLHARYGKDMKDDLRFKEAKPIAGGREHLVAGNELEEGAVPADQNNFQGRYAVRHRWTGPLTCEKPVRGRWGGPPREIMAKPGYTPTGIKPALDLAFAPRGEVQLATAVLQDVPEIDLKSGASNPGNQVADPPMPSAGSASGSAVSSTESKKKTGCGCQASDRNGWLGGALLVGAALVLRRRRKD
jgi:MYXO-CTERM domain-containing protein